LLGFKIDRWQTDPLIFFEFESDVNTRVGVSDTMSYGILRSPQQSPLNRRQPIARKSFKGIPVEVNQVPETGRCSYSAEDRHHLCGEAIEQVAARSSKKIFRRTIDYKSILLDTTGSITPVVNHSLRT